MLTAFDDFLILKLYNIVIQSEVRRSEQEHDQCRKRKNYGIRRLVCFLSTFGRVER